MNDPKNLNPEKYFTKKQALITVRNNALNELTMHEVNYKIMKREELAGLTLNPELTTKLKQVEVIIDNFTRNLKIIDEMIQEEEKELN